MDSNIKIRKENEILYQAQELLKMWAAWLKQTSGQHLGYPKASPYVIERVDNEYNGTIDSPEAEKVDRDLCNLKAADPKVYDALEVWYLYGKDRIEAAHHCKCSKAAFDSRKRYGEWFIIGTINNP